NQQSTRKKEPINGSSIPPIAWWDPFVGRATPQIIKMQADREPFPLKACHVMCAAMNGQLKA
ncbi:hypothetical protein, partial [Acetobacter persici]|uniref:hypothetical protein n=1 Tax=Acetobacter persici TaxID=1076596 RepID=UPI0039EC3F67